MLSKESLAKEIIKLQPLIKAIQEIGSIRENERKEKCRCEKGKEQQQQEPLLDYELFMSVN